MSLPEVLLWRLLRQAPVKFRRQHPIGPYVLDFYCPSATLAIEVDGAAHDFGGRPQRDEVRSAWLACQGVQVLRIAASEVLRDPGEVGDAILRLCERPLHHSAALSGPPPQPAAREDL